MFRLWHRLTTPTDELNPSLLSYNNGVKYNQNAARRVTEKLTQLPMAKVVAEGDWVDLDGLRRFCYRRLAQYKVPKGFELAVELPKTKSGKIKRN